MRSRKIHCNGYYIVAKIIVPGICKPDHNAYIVNYVSIVVTLHCFYRDNYTSETLFPGTAETLVKLGMRDCGTE